MVSVSCVPSTRMCSCRACMYVRSQRTPTKCKMNSTFKESPLSNNAERSSSFFPHPYYPDVVPIQACVKKKKKTDNPLTSEISRPLRSSEPELRIGVATAAAVKAIAPSGRGGALCGTEPLSVIGEGGADRTGVFFFFLLAFITTASSTPTHSV